MGYANTCPDCNCEFDPGHSCPPKPIGLDIYYIDAKDCIAALRAENARLQERVEEVQADFAELKQIGSEHYNNQIAVLESERDALQARVEEAEEDIAGWKEHWKAAFEVWKTARALAERRKKALPDPDRLETLAEWIDLRDDGRGYTGDREVQRDLRRWAKGARAAIEEEGK